MEYIKLSAFYSIMRDNFSAVLNYQEISAKIIKYHNNLHFRNKRRLKIVFNSHDSIMRENKIKGQNN